MLLFGNTVVVTRVNALMTKWSLFKILQGEKDVNVVERRGQLFLKKRTGPGGQAKLLLYEV